MAEPNPDVGMRIAKGAAWLVGMRWALRLLGFVNLIILARLLDPSDFGVAALAIAVANILDQMSEFRTDLALIHNPEAARPHYDTAWTFALIRGVVLAAIIAVAAQPVAGFLEEPRLEACIYVLSIALLVQGAKNIGTVDFFKGLRLHQEFKMTMVSQLSSFTVVVTLAFLLQSYWALVAGFITFRIVQCVCSYLIHPYRPRLNMAEWREIFSFSKWMWSSSVLYYIAYASDLFVLGKLAGTGPTGFYALARRASEVVGSELVGPVRNALFPGFVQLVPDRPRFRQAFIDSFALVFAVGLPATIGFILIAEPFTLVLLDEKWAPAIPIMQVLAVAALLIICVSNTTPALYAIGRPDLWTWVLATRVVIVLPLLVLAINAYGAVGAAAASAIAGVATLLMAQRYVRREIEVGFRDIVPVVWRSCAAVAAMAAVVLAVRAAWPDGGGFVLALGELVLAVGAGGVTYLAAHGALWRASGYPEGAESHVWRVVAPRLRRLSMAGILRRGSRA